MYLLVGEEVRSDFYEVFARLEIVADCLNRSIKLYSDGSDLIAYSWK